MDEFKRLLAWVKKCPVEAAMLLEELENKRGDLTQGIQENARLLKENEMMRKWIFQDDYELTKEEEKEISDWIYKQVLQAGREMKNE